ncbi:MAG: PIN domain-containing protein [Treponema sp.]|nr:PIN domain-containing protein [Treponema sp.]
MRDINILIDSNIILDVVQEREPFTSNAKNILSQCITRRINGFVTAHSLCDIFYILRKDKTLEERLSLIGTLCKYVTVLSERQSDFEDIANNPETRDLEDSLQMVCAENYALDYIVTRNTKDFSASKIPAIEPDTFINILKV